MKVFFDITALEECNGRFVVRFIAQKCTFVNFDCRPNLGEFLLNKLNEGLLYLSNCHEIGIELFITY